MINDDTRPMRPDALIKTSRSRFVGYANCARYGLLAYDFIGDGVGLESVSASLPLINGIVIHEVIAGILKGVDPEEALEKELGKYRADIGTRGVRLEDPDTAFLLKEQETMLRGTVYAWLEVRYPLIMKEYEIVSVEKELFWEMGGGVADQIRVDLLARRRSDGALFYVEWKTTTTGGEDWAKQWEHNTQLLLNTLAVEELLGERCEGVIIEGLVKGRRKIDDALTSPFMGRRIQQSPLCYGWKNSSTNAFRSKYTSASGWFKVATWEEMPIKEWVSKIMDMEEKRKLFAPVPAIRPNRKQLTRARNQVIAVEQERAEKLKFVRSGGDVDLAFPMNDDHCFRYWGHPCEFEPLCFKEEVASDPIGSGLYQRKESHHKGEGNEQA